MDSLVFLCARCLVSHRPTARRALLALPAELYPVLFRAAFLDGRTLALHDLVTSWPFPVLAFQRLLGRQNLEENPSKPCIQAVVSAVVTQLQHVMEESWAGVSESRCRLHLLDMTGLQSESDSPDRSPEGLSLWSGTVAVAKACLALSEPCGPKRGSKRRKGPRQASPTTPQPFGVEIRTDLFVNGTSLGVLRRALRSSGPLRLRCRDFHAEELSAAAINSLLEALEPTGVRRIDLRFNNLGLPGLCLVLPQLTGFRDLLSLRLPYSNVDTRRVADAGLQRLAALLGKLQGLKELSLGSSRLSGKLKQVLSDLQTPLESLELAYCSLLASDFTFLCQSHHAPVLRKLDLSGHFFSEELLQPLRSLLEESSASLLHLDLIECHLTDSALDLLLPTLCRCSRLRSLGIFGNPLSVVGLKNLLRRTVVLTDLSLVIYPYPTDCFAEGPPFASSGLFLEAAVDEERLATVRAELGQMLADSGRAGTIWTTSLCHHGARDYFTL
ncbi:LRC14 protein, partial [Rhinopomastus cyanomelas]|nr:LRC14 protein [Rhinopomastus cyanomelas]